jgi:hypothetical protein
VSEQETFEKSVKPFVAAAVRLRVLFAAPAATAFCCRRAAAAFLLAAIAFFLPQRWRSQFVQRRRCYFKRAANGYFASSSPRRNS